MVRADQPICFERGRNSTHSTARLLLPAWRSVPGAATWVRRVLRVPLGQADAVLPFPRKQLLDLPQQNVSWQIGLRKLDPEQDGDVGAIIDAILPIFMPLAIARIHG